MPVLGGRPMTSRLRQMVTEKTITVYERNSAGVPTAVNAALTSVTVMYQEVMRSASGEYHGGLGEVGSVLVCQFWFYRNADPLPAITEKHIICEDGNATTQYQIANVIDQGGQQYALMVETQRRRL